MTYDEVCTVVRALKSDCVDRLLKVADVRSDHHYKFQLLMIHPVMIVRSESLRCGRP